MGVNEAQVRAQNYYDHVQFFNREAGNQAAWIAICSNLFHMDNSVPNEQLDNQECQTYYGKYQMENVAWTISLVLMSWVLRNFQRKIEDGHCQNTAHPHGEGTPRNCELGRNFHKDMLKKCLRSYRDIINTFDPPQTPPGTPITDSRL